MFYLGVDYYPEQWLEERWPHDSRLMAEAGFNLVRLAEFAWSKLEPQEGHFDFDWLDRAISILDSHGMQVILGTPTASPPPWLMTKHPDIFRVREDGRRVTFGNRRTYCPNNPTYHDHTWRLVTGMAEHYAKHPTVLGWQIDNEFGDRCYCPVCARAFQKWLHRHYGSLDNLNEKWGTTFWSHVYTEWEQIPLPLTAGAAPRPGLPLDFFRFSSDSYVAYLKRQLEALRKKCPQHVITHNFRGFKYDHINYFDLARDLDFVAWDNYPRTQWSMQAQVDPSLAALAADTMRGLKRQNFWVMEQQAGPGGWDIVGVAPRPGEVRLWAYQAVARGADAILFFRWRTARFGTEQYWHGLLHHDGSPSRQYQEVKRMGAEISQIAEQICGSVLKPPVAMMLSYDARFAFDIQGNNPGFSYADQFHEFYSAFYRYHVPVDIVAPEDDLSDYRLVVAPALHIVSGAIAENLKRFVEGGGVLVLTPRSGVKDEANAVVDRRPPGPLAELCGAEVEDYDSLAPDVSNALEFTLPDLAVLGPLSVSSWCDVLKPNGATVVAHYTRDYYAGKPAITLNEYEQPEGQEPSEDLWRSEGWVVYVGTIGTEHLYRVLVDWLLELSGVRPILDAPEGIEVTVRQKDDQRLLFLLNHAENDRDILLPRPMTDLLSGRSVERMVSLEPNEVMILHNVR